MTDALDRYGPLGSFDHADVDAWASSGPPQVSFDEGLLGLLRVQFLRATVGSSLGPDVERGLVGEELAATLALAARPSSSWQQHGAKKAALRSHASRRSSTDLVSAMVLAALRHDERRLARTTACVTESTKERARVEGVRPLAEDDLTARPALPPELPRPGRGAVRALASRVR